METLQRRSQNSQDKIFGDTQDWEESLTLLFQYTQEEEEGDELQACMLCLEEIVVSGPVGK